MDLGASPRQWIHTLLDHWNEICDGTLCPRNDSSATCLKLSTGIRYATYLMSQEWLKCHMFEHWNQTCYVPYVPGVTIVPHAWTLESDMLRAVCPRSDYSATCLKLNTGIKHATCLMSKEWLKCHTLEVKHWDQTCNVPLCPRSDYSATCLKLNTGIRHATYLMSK